MRFDPNSSPEDQGTFACRVCGKVQYFSEVSISQKLSRVCSGECEANRCAKCHNVIPCADELPKCSVCSERVCRWCTHHSTPAVVCMDDWQDRLRQSTDIPAAPITEEVCQ